MSEGPELFGFVDKYLVCVRVCKEFSQENPITDRVISITNLLTAEASCEPGRSKPLITE